MIANLRERDFLLKAHAEGSAGRSAEAISNLIVRDEGRVLAAGRSAEESGFGAGTLVTPDTEIPESLVVKPFDLDRMGARQDRLLEELREYFFLMEVLDYGEVQVEVEEIESVRRYLEEAAGSIRVAVAPTGWLARVLNHRRIPSRFQWVSSEEARDVTETIRREEFWGLGERMMDQLREMEIRELGEVFYLPDQERRRLFGRDARILERLMENRDPRPINAFGRPTKVEQEMPWPVEGDDRRSLRVKSGDLLGELAKSSSLAHRVSIKLQADAGTEYSKSRELSTPIQETEVLFQNVLQLAQQFPEVPEATARLELSEIVADLERYHQRPREDEADLEIL